VLETQLSDRRHYPLTLVEEPLMVLFDFAGGVAAREPSTVDLSQTGARIRTDIELTPGQSADLLATDNVSTVPGQVVWVGNTGPDCVCEIGLQFLRGARLG
jgi:PilZ domain